MRLSQFVVVFDTCVLAPMPVVDTLLRLAEEPAFYTPKWSAPILEELRHVLRDRFRLTEAQVDRRIKTMTQMFPDAMVDGFDGLIPAMKNHEEDRHVLAVAVKSGAHIIVSDNVKHFPDESLAPYNLDCITVDQFLRHQYHLDPDSFISTLTQQAADINWSLHALLSKHVPALSELIKTKE